MTSAPSTSPTLPAFRLPAYVGAIGGAALAGVLVGTGMGIALGWSSGGDGLGSLVRTGFLALLPWAIGAIMGGLLLVLVSKRAVENLGMATLAASMARMMTALLVGIVLYMTVPSDGRTFWVCFLLIGLFMLGAETSWALRNLATLSSRPAGAIPGGHGVSQ